MLTILRRSLPHRQDGYTCPECGDRVLAHWCGNAIWDAGGRPYFCVSRTCDWKGHHAPKRFRRWVWYGPLRHPLLWARGKPNHEPAAVPWWLDDDADEKA